MVQFLETTPGWIYLLFAYFLILGVRASQPTLVSFKQLAAIPVFCLGWSLYNLITDLGARYALLSIWAMALGLGLLLGYWKVKNWSIRVHPEHKSLALPGSWSTLLLTCSMFLIKYLFAFLYSKNPAAIQNLFIFGSDLLITGFFVGIFWGRLTFFSLAFFEKEEE